MTYRLAIVILFWIFRMQNSFLGKISLTLNLISSLYICIPHTITTFHTLIFLLFIY